MKEIPQKTSAVTQFAVLDDGTGQRVFIKSYGKAFPSDVSRGKALLEISQKSGLFKSPRPLAIIEAQGIVIWDYLPGLIALRHFLIRDVEKNPGADQNRFNLFQRIGKSLSEIHQHLPAGEPLDAPPVFPLNSGYPPLDAAVESEIKRAPVKAPHGDFSAVNIFFSTEGNTQELVILDPTPNNYVFKVEGLCPKSSIYIDCAQLLYSLRFQQQLYKSIQTEFNRYIEALVSGYFQSSGYNLHLPTLWACMGKIAIRYQEFYDSRYPAPSFREKWEARVRKRTAQLCFKEGLRLLQAKSKNLGTPTEIPVKDNFAQASS